MTRSEFLVYFSMYIIDLVPTLFNARSSFRSARYLKRPTWRCAIISSDYLVFIRVVDLVHNDVFFATEVQVVIWIMEHVHGFEYMAIPVRTWSLVGWRVWMDTAGSVRVPSG